MTPVSLTTASQITTEQSQPVPACALQPGSVSPVCCESHVASGIFMPAFSKWQNKTSSLKNTNGHCSHTDTRTHTCILILCSADLEGRDFERKFSSTTVGYSLQVRNRLKSYYCLSFPVSLRDKDSTSNMAFMYPRFFNASINYSLNSKKQRSMASVFSTQVYRNYFAKGAAALLSIRPIVCR